MTRQQAGVSAEADGLDVPFWDWWKQSGFLPACSLVAHAAWKAALATAPPDEAQRDAYGDLIPPSPSVKVTYGKPTKKQVEKFERTIKEMMEGRKPKKP